MERFYREWVRDSKLITQEVRVKETDLLISAEKDIKEIARHHSLTMVSSLGLLSSDNLLYTAIHPCGEEDWRNSLHGQCLSLFFLTTLDRTTTLRDVFFETVKRHGWKEGDVGIYIQPVVQNHMCHVEFMVPFSIGVDRSLERARELEKEAVRNLAAAGAFFSRPYGSAGDVVFKQNPVQHALLTKMKAVFDPNRVLNTGKWGL